MRNVRRMSIDQPRSSTDGILVLRGRVSEMDDCNDGRRVEPMALGGMISPAAAATLEHFHCHVFKLWAALAVSSYDLFGRLYMRRTLFELRA